MKAAQHNLIFNRKGEKLLPTDKALIQIEVYFNRKKTLHFNRIAD